MPEDPDDLSRAQEAGSLVAVGQGVVFDESPTEHGNLALGVSQPNVSRIEHQDDAYLSTLRSYVEALGGRLEVQAVFEDQTVRLDLT